MIIFHSNDVSSSKLVSDWLLIDQWFGSGISEIVQTKVEVECLLRLSVYNACRILFRSAGCKLSPLTSHNSVLITFAGLEEISSLAFIFTLHLKAFLSISQSLASWLCSRLPDSTFVVSKSVLSLALKFFLLAVQLQDIYFHLSWASFLNVYPSTIVHGLPISVSSFVISRSMAVFTNRRPTP